MKKAVAIAVSVAIAIAASAAVGRLTRAAPAAESRAARKEPDWLRARQGTIGKSLWHEGRRWSLARTEQIEVWPTEVFESGDPDVRLIVQYDQDSGEIVRRVRQKFSGEMWVAHGETLSAYGAGAFSTEQMLLGKTVGLRLVYRADGTLEREETWLGGRSEIESTGLFASGRREWKAWYEDEKEIASQTWNEEGKLVKTTGSPP